MTTPRQKRSLAVFGWLIFLPCQASFGEGVTELGVAARYIVDESEKTLAELELLPVVEWSRESLLLRLSARARAQDGEMLDRRPPSLRTYSSASRPKEIADDQFAELRDAYAAWWMGPWQFTLGKQNVNWGTIDGYRILDTVNPQDFREFILDNFDDARISTWSAHIERGGPRWQWQFFWSPDSTVHDLPDVGTSFDFRAPRLRFGLTPTFVQPEFTVAKPSRDTYGLRLTHQAGDWNASLVVIEGFEHEPIATSQDVQLQVHYSDKHLIGGNLERSFGALVLRAEAAWRRDRAFTVRLGNALATAEADQVTAAVGVDITGPWDVLVSAQLIRDQVIDAPPGLTRPAFDTLTTLFLQRQFQNDTLKAELRWYSALEDGDGLARAILSKDTDGFGKWSVGADVFYGKPVGLFSQFREQDRLYVEWQHDF